MVEIIRANSSKGTVIVTDFGGMRNLVIRLAGNERTISRQFISEIRIGLGMWYFVGFLRVLTIFVQGERYPIVLANMSKSKALAIKASLGF